VALEDSLVTMSTILASRYVGGIRAEVEKVDRQLAMFAETLEQWMQVGRRGGHVPWWGAGHWGLWQQRARGAMF
jgi:hypothetical protein